MKVCVSLCWNERSHANTVARERLTLRTATRQYFSLMPGVAFSQGSREPLIKVFSRSKAVTAVYIDKKSFMKNRFESKVV